jgi:hypothetical protein
MTPDSIPPSIRSSGRLRSSQWIAAILLAAVLLVVWVECISNKGVEKDAAQNVQLAFNLERHGVISMEDEAPYVPSNYREPLPVLVTAGLMQAIDSVAGPASLQTYTDGARVRLLKYQNVAWMALLSVGAFAAIYLFTGSFYQGLAGVLLVNLPLARPHTALDDLYTEIPAAALLIWASLALAVALNRRTIMTGVSAGLLFGLLTLIKAITLYVFAGTLIVLVGIYLRQKGSFPVGRAVQQLAAMSVAFVIVVAPWVYRNKIQLGTYHFSQRAGMVLLGRAVNDLVTPEEYKGVFYVWSPRRLQDPLGRLLGFSPADLRRNGRLQRLNDDLGSEFSAQDLAAERNGEPEKAISFYRQARAERVKVIKEFEAAGHPRPEIAADDALAARAENIIEHHPWQHLALTLAFLWRGAFMSFPILVLAFVFYVRAHRYDLALFATPALGSVLLYALGSPFIGRYNMPALAIASVVLVLAVAPLLTRFRLVIPKSVSQTS